MFKMKLRTESIKLLNNQISKIKKERYIMKILNKVKHKRLKK